MQSALDRFMSGNYAPSSAATTAAASAGGGSALRASALAAMGGVTTVSDVANQYQR